MRTGARLHVVLLQMAHRRVRSIPISSLHRSDTEFSHARPEKPIEAVATKNPHVSKGFKGAATKASRLQFAFKVVGASFPPL